MGSWLKTCGLTGLPIYWDEEVYVFILEQQLCPDNLTTMALYKPVLLPFLAKYDDYGLVDNFDSKAFDIVFEGVKSCLVDIDGSNEPGQMAISKNTFTPEVFFTSMREKRLFVDALPYPITKKVPIVHKNGLQVFERSRFSKLDFVLMKKSAVDSVLATFPVMNLSFEELLYQGKILLQRMQEYLYKETDLSLVESKLNNINTRFFYVKEDNLSLFYRILSDKTYSSSGVVKPFAALLHDNNLDEACLQQFLTGIVIDSLLDETRKIWKPGFHEGCQKEAMTAYKVLLSVTDNEIERLSKIEEDDDISMDEPS